MFEIVYNNRVIDTAADMHDAQEAARIYRANGMNVTIRKA